MSTGSGFWRKVGKKSPMGSTTDLEVGNRAVLFHRRVLISSMVQMVLVRKRVPSCIEPAGDSGDAFQQLSERGECGRREIQPQNFN